jgi:hypothetical protein
VLTIDSAFTPDQAEQILQALQAWCRLDATMCLATQVGPVVHGQPNSVRAAQDPPASTPCAGGAANPGGQVQLYLAVDYAAAGVTVLDVAKHELGHYFGAVHTPALSTVMNANAGTMARCLTAEDLTAVCVGHQCVAPAYDLVCTPNQAVRSNPANGAQHCTNDCPTEWLATGQTDENKQAGR